MRRTERAGHTFATKRAKPNWLKIRGIKMDRLLSAYGITSIAI